MVRRLKDLNDRVAVLVHEIKGFRNEFNTFRTKLPTPPFTVINVTPSDVLAP